jgi:predicted  nucleic acid-binding Zn-ribbon protein
MTEYRKCTMCGRNYKGLSKIMCPECARMNYMYNQGAITLETWKKWEKSWIKDFR